MIEIKNLTKKFDNVAAVDSLNLTLSEGITGVVGENGAGKSTLFRLISGIIDPTEGEILIDGYRSDTKEAKERIFFLPDNPYVPSGSYLRDIGSYYSCFYELDSDKYNSLLNTFSLPADKRVSTFSKGMRRQAMIALALSVKTPYLFLDEAFDGLDPLVLETIKGELIRLSQNGESIVVSSHNVSTLQRLAERTLILYKGKLSSDGDSADMGIEFVKYQMAANEEVRPEDLIREGLDLVSLKVIGSISYIVLVKHEDDENKLRTRFNPILLEPTPMDEDEIVLANMILARREGSRNE